MAAVKLVRTTSRTKAKVKISYGSNGARLRAWPPSAGPSGAFVRLSPSYASVDSTGTFRRIEVMAIFAHELGHVLGFGHTHHGVLADALGAGRQCLLPARVPPEPATTSAAPSTPTFVRGSSGTYGGRAHFPPNTWCLIDPMPAALAGLTFSGGVDSPVTLRWSRPATVPTGSKVEGAGDLARRLPAPLHPLGPTRSLSRRRRCSGSDDAVQDEVRPLLPGQARQSFRCRQGCCASPDGPLDAAPYRTCGSHPGVEPVGR